MITFVEIFNKIREDHKSGMINVAIFTHPEPDPDSLGSCLGMKLLLMKKWNIHADIFMEGDYSSRRQNMAMVNVLGIELRPMHEFSAKAGEYVKCMVLDATPERIMDEDAKDAVSIVIDHHNVTVDRGEMDYVDIRKMGSCCTMIFQMMKELSVVPGESESERVVATAMIEGIRTDTDMYRRFDTTSADFAASLELFELSDMDLIDQIEKCKLPRYHFDMRAEIVKDENCEVVNGSTFIACAGSVSQTRVESLPILADEIINDMDGITTSIVFAVVGSKVELRMRSNDVSMDVNRFLKKHFGSYGGAKYGSGGASIPLGLFGSATLPMSLQEDVFDLTRKVIITVLSQDVKSE